MINRDASKGKYFGPKATGGGVGGGRKNSPDQKKGGNSAADEKPIPKSLSVFA